MDCATVTSHLVGYHLGLVAGDERGTLEAHLLGCRSCLEKYIALKRASDQAARAQGEASDRPSPEVRARLRAAVAHEFASPARRAKVSLFTRRIPLYQGVALAAVFLVQIAAEAGNLVQDRFEPVPLLHVFAWFGHGVLDFAMKRSSARGPARS